MPGCRRTGVGGKWSRAVPSAGSYLSRSVRYAMPVMARDSTRTQLYNSSSATDRDLLDTGQKETFADGAVAMTTCSGLCVGRETIIRFHHWRSAASNYHSKHRRAAAAAAAAVVVAVVPVRDGT